MRKILLCSLVQIGVLAGVYAQSSDRNYVITQTYKTPTGSVSGSINVASQEVAYFDGLGRPVQTVSVYSSPSVSSGKAADLVSHTNYDPYGRVSQVTLPYPQTGGNGAYQSSALSSANSYYNNAVNFANPINRGYALTEYESSPLDRVVKQYAGGTDKAVEYEYGVNGSNDVKLYTVSGNTLQQPVYYGSGQLSYVEIKDENGNRSREYKDKLGLTVLNRVYTDKNNSNSNLDTYYVYDDLSRVRFVLQPAYQDQANGSHYFYYEYNDRGLMIKKGVPGGGITELTYNERDLLSESKDGTTTITYYKYDAHNRLTETGEKQGGSEVPLSRRYYDSYPSGVTGFSNIGVSGYPTSRRSNVKGLVTATATRILNPDGSKGSTWYYTAYYYNDRLQLIQTTRQLFDLGSNAVEYTTLSLRFDGRVEKQMITQQVVTGTNSVEEVYTYDHADRLLTVQNTIKKESTVKVDTW